MDIIMEEEPNIIVGDFTAETVITRFFGNEIVATPIDIELGVEILSGEDEAALPNAVMKFTYFVNEILYNCLAVSIDNAEAFSFLIDGRGSTKLRNRLMLTPHAPSDELLATLLQSKFDALAGENIRIQSCRVSTQAQINVGFTFIGRGHMILPEMKEWVGDRSFFAEPWWNRDDASIFDIKPAEDADLTVTPSWAYDIGPIVAPKPAASGEVVRPAFRPKVVDGGKN
jgi:hypothetical protein